ncbi:MULTISPECIES: rhamnan synthesis F family protein [unclassified Variovorax]|uniref:rhamnan synthesis F family protein n=1 Tax=unclassified Variovorax TaxID=663243 RepID=UPI0008B5B4A1|nr:MULTISPECIES: rhamnan synthesis F family protein [unclassified Variovorax]SEI92738.1 Methyltransferase domain-containing protein [Variovorax sp. OK202]SFB84520.1 Methyltransferase domain-containing protein [Variovorax sp. OK212]
MKRLCLFAGYSPENRVDDYVIYYLSELSKFADVYYQAASHASEEELQKLDKVTRGRWAQAHEKYDFGSWQKLIFRLGWQEIEKYDAVILANDSNYGPVRDLAEIFDRMDSAGLDVWGITENYGNARHLQSYFLTLNRPVVGSAFFRNFFESIAIEESKQRICEKYEIGFSKLLAENGFSFAPLIDRSVLEIPFGEDISTYQNTLLQNGSPFLKRKVFSSRNFANENLTQTRALLEERKYPLAWIAPPAERHEPVCEEEPEAAQTQLEALVKRAGDFQAQEGLPPVAPLSIRALVKRMLKPFYQPFKLRVVDKLAGIEHRVGHLAEKTVKIDSDVGDLRSDVGALRSSVDGLPSFFVDVRAQVSGLAQGSRDTAAQIAALQVQMTALSRNSTNTLSRVSDVQTSVAELHGHLDWVQRDILIALMSNIDLKSLQGFKCVTDYPVAYDSPDHIHPVGTVLDHTRHPRFIRACEDFFGSSGNQLSFLDLGCSAGGMVLDAVLRGHIGVGLEGSDISRLQQRAEWRLLRDSLFTCDVTRPFELGRGEVETFKFDVISAWEVLEHLTAEGVEGLFANLARHTRPGSIFACSISQVDGGFTEDGTPLHQTLEPLPWWQERAAKYGFDVLDSKAFLPLDFARGNGNSSVYYRPAHSYQEKDGDCFLVVFQRRRG